MKSTLQAALFAAAMLGASAPHAASVSAEDYRAARSRIEAEYKGASAACEQLAGSMKDVCRTDAQGKQKVARAELEHNRSGKSVDAEKLARIRIESAYDVARERCDGRTGNDKELCLREARTTRSKAITDARMTKKVDAARSEADEEKRKAEYSLARKKCDALARDRKAACLSAASQEFEKN